MGRLFDLDHPFFRPLWIRALVVVLCLAMTAVEFLTARGSPFWGVLFGAIGLYAGWHFFFNFNPRQPGEPPK